MATGRDSGQRVILPLPAIAKPWASDLVSL